MQGHNGVLPFYRRDFVEFKHLTLPERFLRQGIISLLSWDGNNHPIRYGIFEGSQKEIADYIYQSESFVSKHLPTLLDKNPGFKKIGNKYIADDYEAFVYREACTREKKRREQEKAEEKQRLSEQKALVAKEKEEISNRTDIQALSADRTTSDKSSLVSFNGNLIDNESIEDKVKRLVESGMERESLFEGCFCQSGKLLIDCCAEPMYLSLPRVWQEEYT